MKQLESKTEKNYKLIFSIIISISLVWSFSATEFLFLRSGVFIFFGELSYLILMLVLTYGFIPLVVIEIKLKAKYKLTWMDFVFYSLSIFWLGNFLFNKTQLWITD